jgi:serine/threonine protein kinase
MNAVFSCIQADGLMNYRILKVIGKGTYGCVYEAVDLRDNGHVALKKVLPKVEKEGFPITAIREIKALKMLKHENILELYDVLCERNQASGEYGVYMVLALVTHDLVGVQEYRRFHLLSIPEVKCVLYQLLSGLKYLHDKEIIHRDLKLANLLIDDKGVLKISDFGLARLQLPSKPDQTNKVVTRWYRPPELLLGATQYDRSVDMWSVGAIFGELIIGGPVFPGETETHVLRYIFDTIGPPNRRVWPKAQSLVDYGQMMEEVGYFRKSLEAYITNPVGACPYDSRKERPLHLLVADSDKNYIDRKVFCSMFQRLTVTGRELLVGLFQYDATRRISADAALQHPFFFEKPSSCQPSQIRLSPDSVRELQVKDGSFTCHEIRPVKRSFNQVHSVHLAPVTAKKRRK